jgi:hypothetical protein
MMIRWTRPFLKTSSPSVEARQQAVFPTLHDTQLPVMPLHITDTVDPSGHSTLSVNVQLMGLSVADLSPADPGALIGEMKRTR